MSVIAFPTATESEPAVQLQPRRDKPGRPVECIRRRGSLVQGRALESLGHAVEYLVDSRLHDPAGDDGRAQQEAVQILMRCSRAVFAECPEVVSLRRRLRRWVSDRMAGEAGMRRAG